MHRLFDIFPRLESERLLLREWVPEDAPALREILCDPDVYRYLPAFLYERSVPDTVEMIRRCRAECFDTKDSILFGICLKSEPDFVAGIAEIYNYEPDKEKASVGCRLNSRRRGMGIAPEATRLIIDYLLEETDVRKITSHVMAGNSASVRVMEKMGFVLRWSGLREDWGGNEPVLVDKYMLKLTPEEKKERLRGAGDKGQTYLGECAFFEKTVL